VPFYDVQMTIKTVDANPENFVTNSWSCEAVTDGDALLFTNEVVEFYRDIVDLYPNTIPQGGHIYKIYDRADPKPRVPALQGTWTFSSVPSGGPLPPEVAKCLSFQAVPVSGTNQARRRGRVYLGPIKSAQLGTTGRILPATRTLIATSADTLLTASKAATTWYWGVWSTINQSIAEVDNGWVDDEWDIQRSRGWKPTARSTFS